jgi:hypothetical protein
MVNLAHRMVEKHMYVVNFSLERFRVDSAQTLPVAQLVFLGSRCCFDVRWPSKRAVKQSFEAATNRD